MNKQRRERLRGALNGLESIANILQHICDKEEDCMDNYPENLQGTDKYERMEDAVDHLNDAIDKLDEVKESIQAAMA